MKNCVTCFSKLFFLPEKVFLSHSNLTFVKNSTPQPIMKLLFNAKCKGNAAPLLPSVIIYALATKR